MHSIALNSAFARQSTWPYHEDYLGTSGIVMKCPARDPYEERSEDESSQHRWYQDHWGAPSIAGIKMAREWPRDPVEFDDFEADNDDDNVWPSEISADIRYYTFKEQQAKRAKRNQWRLVAARERSLRQRETGGRRAYDQDFAHNVVNLFPEGAQSNAVH